VLQPSLGDCKLHFCGEYFPRYFSRVAARLRFAQTQSQANFVLTSDHDLIALANVCTWRILAGN
jgi:hypothetical protein